MGRISLLTVALLLGAANMLAQRTASDIRKVDFANFHYHGSIGLFAAVENPTRSFALRGGKSGDRRYGMALAEVTYGDLTGDGRDEAIVTLSCRSEGSAAISHVYIFTLRHNRPTIMWAFEGGDRAWGGLRHAYAQNGQLVVELFGRGTHIGGDLTSTESVGLCCPRSFTRARYRWRKGAFRRRGDFEVLSNPMAATNCPTCMPRS
jgi:hypothetical protein